MSCNPDIALDVAQLMRYCCTVFCVAPQEHFLVDLRICIYHFDKRLLRISNAFHILVYYITYYLRKGSIKSDCEIVALRSERKICIEHREDTSPWFKSIYLWANKCLCLMYICARAYIVRDRLSQSLYTSSSSNLWPNSSIHPYDLARQPWANI